jgi:flagellar hook protein FlgE
MSTIQGTFNTGVQAMLAQSHDLSNISTNIANVNTTSYKEQGTHFQTMLNEVSPRDQKFFAVQTIDYRNVDKQGTIATTNRTYDVAINGRGFIVTNTSQDATGTWEYTRDGSFFGKAVPLSTSTNGVPDQGTLLTTADGSYVMGWPADANGNITQTNDLKSLQPILYNNNSVFPAKATTGIQLQANVAANVQGRQHVGLPFVDAAGNTRTVDVGFTLDQASNWNLDMSSVGTDNQPVGVTFTPPNVSFDTKGAIISPTDGKISVTINDPAGPQTLTLDMSKVSQLGGDSSITVQNVTQDGYIEGRLKNTYFDKFGTLIGSYTNEQVRNLARLPVANFNANDNLNALPGNVFTQSYEAGALTLNGVGSPQGSTEFVTGALETSNVDLADQFSKMIVTQRAYSSAAKIVQTADEMVQAARDLKR